MELGTQEKFDKALQIANENGVGFYLGGSDIREEGVFVWESNRRPVNPDFWDEGRPDVNVEKDCLLFYRPENLVDDTHCTNKRAYVCEF